MNQSQTVAAKRSNSLQIRGACFNDYPQIAKLESRYRLETKSREEWEHLWINNPVYTQLAKSWPIGWVLEDSDEKIVGYIGNIPLVYELHGKRLLTATSRAWVVDSAYRSYSLLLLDYFFSQKNVDLYLTTSLNSEAFAGFQSFGPCAVPVGDWDHSRFWITNYAGFVSSWLRTKGVPMARLLGFPLSVLPFLRDRIGARGIRTSGKQELQFCASFDERFDTFWESLKKKRSGVLLGTRTREILDWHFRYALMRYEAWIVCVCEQSKLLAYAIFYRQDNTRIGLKRVRLADFQTLTDDNSLLLPMLACALDRCRKRGIHMLEIVGLSREKAEVIAEASPYRRNLGSWLSFYKANNSQLAERLADPKCWDLSCFDGDSSV
ncbi:MAG TPA: hypothetical protein VMF91_21925 [Bryobacteraceae bacterium]|nr:hypothetical protein [Bryobacteraceae bacterium]